MPATPSFLCLRDHRIERFKPGAVTFTPNLAKRASTIFNGAAFEGDVFATGVKIQGDIDNRYDYDRLTFPRGDEITLPAIGQTNYNHLDTNQGTIVVWLRPDWDGDDGRSHPILYDPSTEVMLRKNRDDQLALYAKGNPRAAVDVSNWTAGTKYLVIARWDAHNPIDATNHACITVGETHTFGGTDYDTWSWTADDPAANLYIGSADGPNLEYPFDGLIEGLTIYRRVLYDGTYGVDAGNGDELDQIYNGGDYAKPIPITGRLDVCFYLPTDESEGILSSGTGEAYTFPHDQDLTGATGTVGGTGLATDDDPIYNRIAYKITGINAVDDGHKWTYNCSGDDAGQNYLADYWIKDDGTYAADLRIRDATNGADITTVSTTGAGAWERLTPNFNRPAGCNSIEIYLEASDANSGNITYLWPGLYKATTGTVAWSDVSLTAVPADFDKSMRSGDLRIDGRDVCTYESELLTAVYGDLRMHIQLQHDADYNVALYRWLYTVYDRTNPSNNNEANFSVLPFPWIIPAFTFEGDTKQEIITDSFDTQRHALRIRWTFNEVAVWLDHELLKRWSGDHFVAGWKSKIHWGYDGIDGSQQLDGWIGP